MQEAAQQIDLAARRPVWVALSELWLDTELDEADLRRIAGVLAASPLDAADLECAYRWEVAPVVAGNLVVPAGVWDAFDPDWLCAEAAKRMGRRGLSERVLQAAGLRTSATDAHWNRISSLVRELRNQRKEEKP